MALAREQITIVDLHDGVDGSTYSLNILGGTRTISYNATGKSPTPAQAAYSCELYKDGVKVTPSSYAWSASGHLSGTSTAAGFTPTALQTYNASLTSSNVVSLTVAYGGMVFKGTVQVVVTKAATDAKLITLVADSQVFKVVGKTVSPATAKITAETQNTSVTAWTYSSNGAAFTGTLPAGVTRSGSTVTITGASMTAQTIAVKASDGTYSDVMTIVKVADGGRGEPGEPAVQPITGFLTNESVTFPADFEGKVTGHTGPVGSFKVFQGTTDVTASASFTASNNVGGTVSISDTGVYTLNSLTADRASVDLKAVYGGVSIVKTLTISKSRAGTPGPEGYTVILTNESHVFPGLESKAVPGSSVTSNIIVYKGPTQIASSVAVTGAPSGMTVTVAGKESKSNSFTAAIHATTAMTTMNGELTVTVTADGKTFPKKFSFAVAKKGTNGTPARVVKIIPSALDFVTNTVSSNPASYVYTPSSIALTPTFQSCTYSKWQYSTNGSTWTNVTTQNGLSINSTSKVLTVSSSSTLFKTTQPFLIFKCESSTGEADVVTLNRIFDSGALGSRLTTAEINLSEQAGEIALRATKTEVSNTVAAAKSTNHGYRYAHNVIVYGDSDKYYPVIIKGGDQNIKRDILVKRAYSEQAPPDWNTATHKGGLTLKLKTNFGGWGGANYSWEIHELEEMYTRTFAGAMNVMSNMAFAIFLRGGGTTGAIYHLYSDQPLDAERYNDTPEGRLDSPQIAYSTDQLIGVSGTYTWYAPAYRRMTEAVEEEIRIRKFINLAQAADASVKAIETRVSSAELKITPSKITSVVRGSTEYINDQGKKVSTNEIISKINQSAEKIQIEASKINIKGKVTFESFDSSTAAEINSKARTFTSTPVPPYSLGDIWKNSTSTYMCKVARATGSYVAADWEKTGDVTSANKAADTSKVGGTAATTVVTGATAGSAAKTATDRWTYTGKTTINGGQIQADTVTATQIKAKTITASEIAANTITTNQLSSEVGESLDLSSNTSITLKVQDTVTDETKNLVASSIVQYYLSTSSTSLAGGSWVETAPGWVNGRFMWSRTKVTTKAGAVTYHPNANGTNITGASGATGRGIASTEIRYAVSSSGTTTPTSWGTTVPTVAPEQYLWTRTTINYDSGSPSVSYSIGQAGKSGLPGANGRSLTSSAHHYQKSTSGTTIPTGSWLTSIPTVAASEYLWTRTTFNYSTAPLTTTAYSVGKMGNTGKTGRGITSITTQYYLSTSKTTQTGGSWGTTPPAFNKAKFLWIRSSIVWNNPTETTTTTPQLSTEWNTLADHETRVYNAEQAITPTEIKNTVSAIKNSEGKPYFAQTSEVKQTVDTWTAKFSSIGGRNLVLDSTNGGKGWTSTAYNVIPDGRLSEDWVVGETYTISIKGSVNSPNRFGVWRDTGSVGIGNLMSYNPSTGVYTQTYTNLRDTTQSTKNLFSVYNAPSGSASQAKIEWIKIEKGSVATDWTPHPDELYTGVTKIDKDGVTVSRSDSDIKTEVTYSGTKISDDHGTIANFGETTHMPFANIDEVQSDDVVGTVFNPDHVHGNYEYEIGKGRTFTTISEALDAIFSSGSRRFLVNDTNIRLYINGTIEDKVLLRGIAGNGRIYIYFRTGAKLYGSIWVRDCMNRIYIRSSTTTGTGRGMIIADNPDKAYAVFNEASKHVHLINVDVNARLKTAAVQGNDTGTTILDSCDVVGGTYGTWCRYSHTLRAVNCRGNATHGHYADQLGIQLIGGTTCINGSSANINQSSPTGGLSLKSGTPSGTSSSFSPPPTSDKEFVQTFRAISLKTKTSTGEWQTYYGDTAAQNRWASTSPYSVGQITFSSDVYSFIKDRKTGTTPTIRIRMRRKNTSHGTSAAIKPDPANFSSTAFSSVSGAVQGGWTGWGKLTVSNFSTSGNTLLTIGTGKTDVNYNPYRYYAIWDIAEVEVTKIKNV